MRLYGISIACGLALALPRICLADPAGVKPVSPSVFGNVFRATRAAMVRVKLGSPDKPRVATGFVIGAQGEVVFGAREAPGASAIEVTLSDGTAHGAVLLAFEPRLHLGVARLVAAGGGVVSTEPLRAADRASLSIDAWVVVLRHDPKGTPEPFAGVVESVPESLPAKKGEALSAKVVRIGAPGAVGSPVLSTDAKLVGVVLEEGARRTRAVTIESLAPFLKAAVLGT